VQHCLNLETLGQKSSSKWIVEALKCFEIAKLAAFSNENPFFVEMRVHELITSQTEAFVD